MNRIHFEVPGNPKAQKRYRDRKGGGKFDPSAADKAGFLALCRDHAPERPIEGPVILYAVFWMPIPKGISQKRVKEMRLNFYDNITSGGIGDIPHRHRPPSYHIKRPDTANMLKLIKDSMNGIYWKDDSQVQIGGAFKIYSHRPRTEIEIIY